MVLDVVDAVDDFFVPGGLREVGEEAGEADEEADAECLYITLALEVGEIDLW